MKTINLIAITFLSIVSGCYNSLLYGQSFDPFTWEDFVKENAAKMLRDTFLLQTFNGLSSDNWSYMTTGMTEVFDATAAGLKNSSEGMSLKLLPGSELKMYIPENKFKSIRIRAHYAVYQLKSGQNLLLSSDRGVNSIKKQSWLTPTNNYTVHFRENKNVGPKTTSFIYVDDSGGYNPENVHLQVQGALSSITSGFYAIDSILASRSVPLYLLFDGLHCWSEEAFWSETLPYTYSTAFIKGLVHVEKDVRTDRLYLGDGDIQVGQDRQLSVNRLFLCNRNISLIASGKLQIKDSLVVNIPFPEKGQWYFFSLPFDVYAGDIDGRFALGDDQTTGSGDYFYLQMYNGEKRAKNKRATDNWEVVPASVMQGNKPVIEKYKGYLIALDAQTGSNDLRFAIPSERIPVNFAETTSVSINIYDSASESDAGWYLCGNPLPSPLLLDQIASNPNLDGNVYVYDGVSYVDYPIGSKYAIPPFGSFFVKAVRDTDLLINATSLSEEHVLLSSFSSLRSDRPEPNAEVTSVSVQQKETVQTYIYGATLYLEKMPSPGIVSVFGTDGKVILLRAVSEGSSSIPLDIAPGIYVINITAGSYQVQHKFIKAQS